MCLLQLQGSSFNLVEKGTNVNTQGRQYGNVLQAASSKDHSHSVRFVIERSAQLQRTRWTRLQRTVRSFVQRLLRHCVVLGQEKRQH